MKPKQYFVVRIERLAITTLTGPTENYEEAKAYFDELAKIYQNIYIVETIFG
jgi:hypothetical protein